MIRNNDDEIIGVAQSHTIAPIRIDPQYIAWFARCIALYSANPCPSLRTAVVNELKFIKCSNDEIRYVTAELDAVVAKRVLAVDLFVSDKGLEAYVREATLSNLNPNRTLDLRGIIK